MSNLLFSIPYIVFFDTTSIYLEEAGHYFEWADIKRDIKSLQEIVIEDNGKTMAVRSECKGVWGKIFQSVGVAIPPVESYNK